MQTQHYKIDMLASKKDSMSVEEINSFQAVDEGFSMREAIAEAQKCLQCKVPQCRKGCPIENEIPNFIHALSTGNMGDAMRIINEKSNLPAICGRVCPHEKQCQGHCVMNKKGQPIQIGKIEQFIADFDTKMKLTREKLPQKDRGKIAVIGSGPAGLTVAGDLARKGFSVTIYEGQSEPGGVLMYGIPEYRLPKKVVRAEIEKIEALGVNFICNVLVGEHGVTVDNLFRQGFDAIFMGTGTAIPQDMNSTPGAQLRGVSQSTYFLHMPAIKAEYEQAVNEGVKFRWNTSVTEFIAGENGRLSACRLNTPKGETIEPFDRIYLAIGSRPANRIVSTTEGIEVDEKGYVKVVGFPFGMTTRRGVFAGGDVVHRPQTVVLAMKAAKDVAQGIAQYVDAIKLLEAAKKVEELHSVDK